VQRTYNVTAMTFTPADLAAAIREHIPAFDVRYLPDFREGIARSWPVSIDDSCARRDWGWQPSYDLQARPEQSHLSVTLVSWAQGEDMHAQRMCDHSERGGRTASDVSSNDGGLCTYTDAWTDGMAALDAAINAPRQLAGTVAAAR
jgi:hypothetical protein